MATKVSDAKTTAPKTTKPRSTSATTRRSTTAAKPATEPSVEAALPEVTVKAASEVLKLKALVEEVAKTTGGKKKQIKETVEATLAVISAALAMGHDLNLPPLGKARVGRKAGGAEGGTLTLKLKPANARDGEKKSRKKDMPEGVAAAEE